MNQRRDTYLARTTRTAIIVLLSAATGAAGYARWVREPVADPPLALVGDTEPAMPPMGLPPLGQYTYRQFLNALMQVESGGNRMAVGEDGERGPYQITYSYWLDGGGSSLGYDQDAWKFEVCEKIMATYWLRYCPDAFRRQDWEILARVHNGGPKGMEKKSTIPYWNRIRTELGAG